jgi:acyl-CoA dehydrogenase
MIDDEQRQLAETLESVFARSDRGPGPAGRIGLDRTLWSTLADLGVDRLTGGDSRGGGGATWAESAILLRAAGSNAAPVPVVENDLLAGLLLDEASIIAQDSLIRSAAVLDREGRARSVPWAADVDRLVVLWPSDDQWRVADVPVKDIDIEAGENLAGEPRDHVTLDVASLDGSAVPDAVADEFRLRGALARSHLMTGAMDRIQRIVIEHASARVQFGRPLAKFQAVQHLVADLAAEIALAEATTSAAAELAQSQGFGSSRTRFAVASSRSVSGHAASVVARGAHQVLGAIGFTREHELHRYTNRLLSWRSEFGSIRSWDTELTRAAVDAGSAGLWPLISD